MKSRVISFRLSEQEFGEVAAKSVEQGFSSVSLFARWLTLDCRPIVPSQSVIDSEINRLWRRLEALICTVEEITAKLA